MTGTAKERKKRRERRRERRPKGQKKGRTQDRICLCNTALILLVAQLSSYPEIAYSSLWIPKKNAMFVTSLWDAAL